MKSGDLILYDRFGARHNSVSPSYDPDDMGVGLILQIIQDSVDDESAKFAQIMKDDGSIGYFSLSYLSIPPAKTL